MRVPERLRSALPSKDAVFSVFLAVLVLTGGLTATTGEAAAVELFQDCDVSDSMVSALIRGVISPNQSGECRFNPSDELDYSQVSWHDLYVSSDRLAQSSQITNDAVSNRLTDTRGPAWAEAKIAIIESLNAGENRSQAEAAANKAIEEYYTSMQRNIVSDYNNRAEYALYVQRTEENETGTRGVWLNMTNKGSFDPSAPDGIPITDSAGSPSAVEYYNITLANGSEVPIAHIEYYAAAGAANGYSPRPGAGHPYDNNKQQNITVYSPSGEYTHLIDMAAVDSQLTEVENQVSQLKANTATVTDAYFNYYTAGELNVTDIMSPSEIASRASTDYNSTGYHSFAATELAAMGYSGNISSSMVIEIQSGPRAGEQLEGTMFYTGSDLTKFVTGMEYTPADFSGGFVMAVASGDGKAYYYEPSNPFVVVSQTDTKTGETVSETQLEPYVYSSTDPAKFEEETDRWSTMRTEYQDAATGSSGDGGTGSGGSIPMPVIGGAVVVVAIVAVFASSGGGGGRRY